MARLRSFGERRGARRHCSASPFLAVSGGYFGRWAWSPLLGPDLRRNPDNRQSFGLTCPKTNFVQFADVFPLKEFGYKPEPGLYMEIVGWMELIGGCLLAFGPQLLQEISNFVLTVIMIGAIYTLLVLKEPFAMCVPATVSLGLLLLLNIRGRGKYVKSKSE
uniref:Transmembrane protein 35B n=1 Tax=Laticauda laticaudata TaxID=8630 RepID=A0A8C5RXU6_LATLA